MSDFRTGRHVVHRLNAHLVLTTKYRRDAIRTDRVRDLLKTVMTSVAADMGATVEAVEADGDHIHLLISYSPQLALSKLVGSLKGVSARRLRQQGWPEVRRLLWGTASGPPATASSPAAVRRWRSSGPMSRRKRTPTGPGSVKKCAPSGKGDVRGRKKTP